MYLYCRVHLYEKIERVNSFVDANFECQGDPIIDFGFVRTCAFAPCVAMSNDVTIRWVKDFFSFIWWLSRTSACKFRVNFQILR